MLDLAQQAQALRALLGADVVVYWRNAGERLALPAGVAPANFSISGFLAPQCPQGVDMLQGDDAISLLPLELRARLQPSIGTAMMAFCEDRGGIAAVWLNASTPPTAAAHGQMHLAAIALAAQIRLAGAQVEVRQILRQLIEVTQTLPLGIVVVPGDAGPGHVNQYAARFLDVAAGDVGAATLAAKLTALAARATNAQALRAQLDPIMDGSNRQGLMGLVWHFDTAPTALRVTLAPINPEQPGDWLWLLEDVSAAEAQDSERKHREHEIRQLSEAVQQTTESIVITNLKGDIEYVNPAYLYNTGYSRDELLGKNSRLLQSGRTPRSTYESLWKALGQGLSWKGEFYNRRKDGSEFIEAVSISPIRQTDGSIINYVAAKRDITQTRRMEKELLRAKDSAEAANVAKSQFLTTMSHEVRTPMNSILGMAQLLMLEGGSDSDRISYARTILNSGQTLLRLLNDVLDLAKIESGKVELESIEISPVQIMARAQELFSQSAQAKGLQIVTGWRGPVASYLGDPHRLTQMLSNLVGNALKFTHQGSIRIDACEVSSHAKIATLEFSVTDTGIGIANEKIDTLFQNFTQVDASTTRQYGGTGLGLSIVRTLAQLMGGEVGLTSDAGKGSRFWFRVPAERLAVYTPSPEKPLTTQSLAHVVRTPHSARVLLVEDNLDHQRLSEVVLGRLGLNVATAENGQQALDAIAQGETAQIVLMDLHMPLLDGYTAARQIRQWEQDHGQARRTIVALTANAFEDDRLRCLDAGMDDVITKPVSFDKLQATLARWLPEFVEPQGNVKLLDTAHVRALLQELYPLLENNQVDALARFKDLQDAVADTPLALPIAQAGAALQGFQFDVALAQLQGLVLPP